VNVFSLGFSIQSWFLLAGSTYLFMLSKSWTEKMIHNGLPSEADLLPWAEYFENYRHFFLCMIFTGCLAGLRQFFDQGSFYCEHFMPQSFGY
jgi:hypothetical protein